MAIYNNATFRRFNGVDWDIFYFEPASHTHNYGDITNPPTIPTKASDVGAAASTHYHSATHITSGTLSVARGGTGRGTLQSGRVLVGNGTSAVQEVPRSGIDSRNFFPTNASSIVATGTPSASTYLRGDGTWATPSSGGSTGWTNIVDVQLNDLVPGGGEASASYTSGKYTEFWVVAGSVGTTLNPTNIAHYIMPDASLGAYMGRSLPGDIPSDMNITPSNFSASWDKSGLSSAVYYRLMVYAR